MRRKITVVGAGAVGSATALLVGRRSDAEVVLLDLDVDRASARALDLTAAVALDGGAGRVDGGGWDQAAGSEIVIVSVGGEHVPAAMAQVGSEIARRCPDAVVIAVSTPVDRVTRELLRGTHFPRRRVLGLGTIVDTARLRSLLAHEAGVAVSEVQALVVGAPGGAIVPVTSTARIGGRAAVDVVGSAVLDAVVQRVVGAAGTLTAGLGERPGLLAPAAAVTDVVAAIVDDERRVLPCSVLCLGELGIADAVLAVPVVLGAGGILDIVDVELSETERLALLASADA